MDDLYKTLQVDPCAESEVIRAAYHALARKYHPDIGGDAKRMVACNAAWAVLGNPLLRSEYDAERALATTPPHAVASAERSPQTRPVAEYAPPRRTHDSSTIVDFGRYEGWSLEQLVAKDPNYLEWLVRTPVGRRLSPEIRTLLDVGARLHGAPSANPLADRKERATAGRGWFGRTSQAR